MNKCRRCGMAFLATNYQISKSDFICPPCQRQASKEWRLKRKLSGRPVVSTKMPAEWHKKYDKEHSKKPYVKKRKAELMRIYSHDPALRQKHVARWLLNRAIKSGRIVKKPCENCGNLRSEAHHGNYLQPLEVRWLCRPCHVKYHTKATGETK